jgi:hypothetical protein
MRSKQKAEEFYSDVLDKLLESNLPFMIGGTYAFSAYTGVVRPTKDMDVIATPDDYPKILKVLNEAGYATSLHEQPWIAKVHKDDHFVDVIYAEKNGLAKVDKSWLKRARLGTVLNHQVKLVPVEEMISSKAFIQHRERFDGADVANLFLKYGKSLDWNLLLSRFGPYWQILLSHLILFSFVYPSEFESIPKDIFENLLQKANDELNKSPKDKKEKVTRGLLISSQFEVAVTQWGFKDIAVVTSKQYE